MKAMRDVWGEKLVSLADRDTRTVVLDGDLASSTKADKFAVAHPDRFFQMGIAEQNMVGVAAGLASVGYIPWTSTFTVFLTHRAIDQVRMLVAQTGANVKLAGSYSGLLIGAVGKTHLDVQDLAIMRAMPDMVVLAPADEVELLCMMDWAAALDGPVYIRLARDPAPAVFDDRYAFTPGAIHRLRAGGDTALFSTGTQSSLVLEAAGLLHERGIDAAVWHVPCLKPMDADALRAAVKPHATIVTVEQHSRIGGLGGLLAEVTTEQAGAPRLVRLGLDDTWGESASNEYLLRKHGLSPELIADRVAREVRA